MELINQRNDGLLFTDGIQEQDSHLVENVFLWMLTLSGALAQWMKWPFPTLPVGRAGQETDFGFPSIFLLLISYCAIWTRKH